MSAANHLCCCCCCCQEVDSAPLRRLVPLLLQLLLPCLLHPGWTRLGRGRACLLPQLQAGGRRKHTAQQQQQQQQSVMIVLLPLDMAHAQHLHREWVQPPAATSGAAPSTPEENSLPFHGFIHTQKHNSPCLSPPSVSLNLTHPAAPSSAAPAHSPSQQAAAAHQPQQTQQGLDLAAERRLNPAAGVHYHQQLQQNLWRGQGQYCCCCHQCWLLLVVVVVELLPPV